MWSICAACGKEGTAYGMFVDTGFGKVICMNCGTLQSHELACFANVLPRGYGAVIPAKQTYTRFKRFRRYLQRACVNQCNSSVPDETWEYLHAHRPFRGPRDILYCLKKSKLKQKCYDSLPLFTNVLSDVQVPAMDSGDYNNAVSLFHIIDGAWEAAEPFVSYLFLLEWILVSIGRRDVLPFINKIQCTRRRREYGDKLDAITSHGVLA